jgi:hypothetical protein
MLRDNQNTGIHSADLRSFTKNSPPEKVRPGVRCLISVSHITSPRDPTLLPKAGEVLLRVIQNYVVVARTFGKEGNEHGMMRTSMFVSCVH